MSNAKFTDLPQATSANLTDIICAVQGYSGPSNLGTSVQETLQQVANIIISQTILNYPGNPNGNVAGSVYQLLWDGVDNLLWVCTVTGTTSTAVWTPCIGQLTNGQLIIGSTGTTPAASTLTAGNGISISNGAGSITISSSGTVQWNQVTTNTSMVADNGYITNSSSTITLTLPTTAAVGSILQIVGKGSGGWLIAQNASQQIQIGSAATTSGTSGSVASQNQWDSVDLVCVTASALWVTNGGPQTAGFTVS